MEAKTNFKHIVRIANSDLSGNKSVKQALREIRGVSFMFANAICSVSGVSKNEKIGNLPESDVSKLAVVLQNPLKHGIPVWMFNRKKDPDEGTDKHIFGTDVKFIQENDIKMMKKIRSFKGVRHGFGLPVRGQRTKSNFRRNKGKVMGVIRAKGAAKPAASTGEKKK